MKLRESIRISWRAITGHKLRSTLTTLGVIIGIGSVIVFMVLGGGFEADILGDIEDDDEPVMSVVTQTTPEGGIGVQFVETPIYTQSDLDALRAIDNVAYVAPDGSLPAVQLEHDGERQTGGFDVEATTQERITDSRWELVEGSVFETESEAVVNEGLLEGLGTDAGVGDELVVAFEDGRETAFTIVGVVDDDTEQFSTPALYVDAEAHYTLEIETPSGDREQAYSSVQIAADSPEDLNSVREAVESYFDSEADAAELKDEGHSIQVQTVDDVVDQVTDIIDQLALFLGGIAGISLLVGSIGIANIMIVSVTERVRDIGIMKAVGARKRDVMQLFLVESLILGAVGAVVGVFVGLGFGYLGVRLAGWPMAYPLEWIAIAVFVGVVVGVLSGLYPAWRAAKVDPIDALRHE